MIWNSRSQDALIPPYGVVVWLICGFGTKSNLTVGCTVIVFNREFSNQTSYYVVL